MMLHIHGTTGWMKAQVPAPSTASKIDAEPENKARLSYLNAEAIESKVVPEGALRQRIVEVTHYSI